MGPGTKSGKVLPELNQTAEVGSDLPGEEVTNMNWGLNNFPKTLLSKVATPAAFLF